MRKEIDFTPFAAICREVTSAGRYEEMKKYYSHSDVTVYEHCLSVARRAYVKGIRRRRPVDIRALVRGALLHDYYLYDWHDKNKGFRWHGFKHHRFALSNAERDFDLTEKEKNIIYTHMFPLTFWCWPRSREAWIVTWADKRVALSETLKKYRHSKKAKEHKHEES